MIKNNLWETEEEEFSQLSVLNNISRYNTRYRIKNESVAAHSFYTTWFAASICGHMNLSAEITQLAMECAMVHDIPEIYINDITHDCKSMIPEICSLIQPYEEEILSKISTDAQFILFRPRTLTEKLINKIVQYADVVSVKQYAFSEIKIGNQAFCEILESATKRLEDFADELEKVYEEWKESDEYAGK